MVNSNNNMKKLHDTERALIRKPPVTFLHEREGICQLEKETLGREFVRPHSPQDLRLVKLDVADGAEEKLVCHVVA